MEQRYWQWRVTGRYGRFYVERIDISPGASSGTWGDDLLMPSRKVATKVAEQLNFAYQQGREHGTYMLSGECQPGCTADRCRAMEG